MKTKPNHFAGMRGTSNVDRKNGVKYTVRDNRDRFFYPDEWMAFFDCLKSKQKLTFLTLINTGARIMEVRNIRVSDIDFDRNNIVLRKTKKVVRSKKKGAKGVGKIRVISISSKFSRYLKSYIKGNNLNSDDFIPILSTPAANIAMKKSLRKANIKDWDMFSIHNIRKTLETWLISLGIDSFKITKHFGHTAAIALQHYVSPDLFSWDDKKSMREIIGDLYER